MGKRLKSVFCLCVIIMSMLVSCAKPQEPVGGTAYTTAENTAQEETTVSDTAEKTLPETRGEETTESNTTAEETEPETEPETETEPQEQETWAENTFIPFENSVVQVDNIYLPQIQKDATVIESLSDLSALGLELTKTYDAEFFKDHSLVLVQFEHANGEVAREVTHLVVRDGLIHPVVTIDSQENLSDNFEYTFLTVEIEKTNKKMDFGEVLVINTFNPSRGSAYRHRYE